MQQGARPFLKWVGGKRQLLPVLRRFYPADTGRYFEPFVGSGAVFFDLLASGIIDASGAMLSDDNADLIGCYRRVADSLDGVIDGLNRLASGHAAEGRAHYLRIRDERFNPMRAEWRSAGSRIDDYSVDLAAMLIYLNRTGYNGLFRLNASGAYNVPPGRYDNPKIVDRPLLEQAARALSRPGIVMDHRPFDRAIEDADAGDFVYCDPPYAPISETANFRSYTARAFADADHERLQQALIALASRGVRVLLSNSVAPGVARLYERNVAARRAGLRVWRVSARRAVNSRADRRGAIEELLVSNITPRPVKEVIG